jgi:hypothetical protein
VGGGGTGRRRLSSFPFLDISSELFPEMRPAMRDVWQDMGSVGLVPWALLIARAGVMKPVREDTHQHFSVYFAVSRSGCAGDTRACG